MIPDRNIVPINVKPIGGPMVGWTRRRRRRVDGSFVPRRGKQRKLVKPTGRNVAMTKKAKNVAIVAQIHKRLVRDLADRFVRDLADQLRKGADPLKLVNEENVQMTNAVTLNALIKRINRKLAPKYEALKTYRGGRWSNDLGRYYVIDFNRNAILRTHVDPEVVGRELGVLRQEESVAE
jgi:hypothetical protein